MAIAANRFEFLDKETNVPSLDFLAASDSGVFNQAMAGGALDALGGLGGLGEAVSSMMNGGDIMGSLGKLAESTGIMDSVKGMLGGEGGFSLDSLGGVGDMIRSAKDQLSTVIDFDKLSDLNLDKIGSSLMSGNFDIGAFKELSGAVKLDFLEGAGGGFLDSFGGEGGLSNLISQGKELASVAGDMMGGADVSSLLDSFTGGDKSDNPRKVSSPANQQRALYSMGNLGMRANLPNVYESVSSQVDNPGQRYQLGGALANAASRNGSVNGVMEIANSPTGPYVTSNAPNISNQFISNFQIPPGTTSIQREQLYEESVQTLNKVDPKWSSSTYQTTTIKSVEKITITQSPWTGMLQTQCLQVGPATDGSVTAPSDAALLYAGQQAKQASANSGNASDPFAAMRMQNPGYGAILR
jgi:hypothetical protein